MRGFEPEELDRIIEMAWEDRTTQQRSTTSSAFLSKR